MLYFASGCVHFYQKLAARPDFEQAENYAKQGNFGAAAVKYEQIISRYPRLGDWALFQLGVVHLSPQNKQKDYAKALESLQRVVDYYPQSRYRRSCDVLISLIADISNLDKKAGAQHKQIEKLEQQLEQMKEVDMNLKQKKKIFP